MQIVNEGGRNPGIRYSYAIPQIIISQNHTKDHTQPFISKSAIDKPSRPHKKHKPNNHGHEDKANAIEKPKSIRIKTERVMQAPAIAQTNVKIVSRHKDRYDDVSLNKGNTSSLDNTRQFVYAHGVQVYGGENSITKNVFNGKKDEVRERVDVTIGYDSDNLKAQEIRYNSYSGNAVAGLELETVGSDTETVLLSDQRYMWSDGQWTSCSSKCGEGKFMLHNL